MTAVLTPGDMFQGHSQLGLNTPQQSKKPYATHGPRKVTVCATPNCNSKRGHPQCVNQPSCCAKCCRSRGTDIECTVKAHNRNYLKRKRGSDDEDEDENHWRIKRPATMPGMPGVPGMPGLPIVPATLSGLPDLAVFRTPQAVPVVSEPAITTTVETASVEASVVKEDLLVSTAGPTAHMRTILTPEKPVASSQSPSTPGLTPAPLNMNSPFSPKLPVLSPSERSDIAPETRPRMRLAPLICAPRTPNAGTTWPSGFFSPPPLFNFSPIPRGDMTRGESRGGRALPSPMSGREHRGRMSPVSNILHTVRSLF